MDIGLLLRSDVHTMFDRGYLGVDPGHRLMVSPRLRADFGNEEQFYAKSGQVIDLPDHRPGRPGREFLQWKSTRCSRRREPPGGRGASLSP
jgi:putative restriction endonuclease